jgi:hypothetical protein
MVKMAAKEKGHPDIKVSGPVGWDFDRGLKPLHINKIRVYTSH